MKKTPLIIAFALLSVSLFNSSNVKAQNEKGQVVATFGAGGSLTSLAFKVVQAVLSNTPGSKLSISQTPGLQGMVDYGFSDKFSLGLAVSYQQFTLDFANAQWINTKNDTFVGNWTDKATRLNYGIRPLFHLSKDENMDLYIGPRISMTTWTFSTTNKDPYFNFDQYYKKLTTATKVQVLLGVRYFFTKNFGINGEIAIGVPYYIMGGINLRFGGSAESASK